MRLQRLTSPSSFPRFWDGLCFAVTLWISAPLKSVLSDTNLRPSRSRRAWNNSTVLPACVDLHIGTRYYTSLSPQPSEELTRTNQQPTSNKCCSPKVTNLKGQPPTISPPPFFSSGLQTIPDSSTQAQFKIPFWSVGLFITTFPAFFLLGCTRTESKRSRRMGTFCKQGGGDGERGVSLLQRGGGCTSGCQQ